MSAVFDSEDNVLLHVRFFGDHADANVPIDMCYLYSEKYPDDSEAPNLEFESELKVVLHLFQLM